MIQRTGLTALLAASTVLMACGDGAPDPRVAAARPNILLLVADDLGYADLGSYGGDVSTPNIDALADRGVRFSQFHTAPMCAPTRAMLLTGNDNHVAGMGIQGGGGALAGRPGYEGHLSERVVPFPRLLRDAGYHTYSVGKWHLGTAPEHSPTAAGFERSFQLLQGAGDHFSDIALSGRDSISTYWEDGAYGAWPEGGYSTEVYTDRLIEFIEDGSEDGRPFFALAAYTSPHWPLQVPDEDLELYRGRYDMGYDRLRELRFESLQGAGIIPVDHQLPPRLDWIAPWEDLTEEERRVESRKMELYAAMVENLDRHIGRLLGYLDERGMLDNTMGRLRGTDDGPGGQDLGHVGDLNADDLGPKALQFSRGDLDRRGQARVHAVQRIGSVEPDPNPLHAAIEFVEHAWHRSVQRGGVIGITTRNCLEDDGRVPHASRHRTDVIERLRKRQDAVTAHPAVCGLQPDDATGHGREADRPAGGHAGPEVLTPGVHGYVEVAMIANHRTLGGTSGREGLVGHDGGIAVQTATSDRLR